MSFNNIPSEMRAYRQWIVWRLEINADDPEGKPRKVPYSPHFHNTKASVTNPDTWSSFERAVEMCGTPNQTVWNADTPTTESGYAGIGFVLTKNDPFLIVDLDNPHGDDTIFKRQQDIYMMLASYSERSPSGEGLHIIVKGSIEAGRRRSYVEMYSDARYMTMTGDVFNDAPIHNRPGEIAQLWQSLGGGVALHYYEGTMPQMESDEIIVERARNARNGDKFSALYDGEWRDYFGPQFGHDGIGQSEADFALVDILAFYTQNRAQIRRIFMRSQLGKREKITKHRNYVTWMVNKSFDRLLPPVDIVGLKDQLSFEVEGLQAIEAPKNEVLPLQPSLSGFEVTQETAFSTELPPGLVGQIAEFIYMSSPTPVKEVALVAALALVAGIAGERWNVSGGGLNQYFLLLAPTGAGKEAMASGISRLMTDLKTKVPAANEFLGPSMIASGQAIARHISKTSQCFLSIIGEFGVTMQSISAKNASGHQLMLLKMLLELYHKSGKGNSFGASIFADGDKNVGSVPNPAFSLLGESVPEEFYKLLDNGMITGGLLPRMTIIEYTGRVPYFNKNHNKHPIPFDLTDGLAKLASGALGMKANNKFIDVAFTPDAEMFCDKFGRICTDNLNDEKAGITKHLWNRGNLKVMRLAATVAVGIDPYTPLITMDHVKWAHSIIVSDIKRLSAKYESGNYGDESSDVSQITHMKKILKECMTKPLVNLKSYGVTPEFHAAKVIPYSFLQRRLASQTAFKSAFGGSTAAIQRTIKTLIESGVLTELGPSQTRNEFKTTQRLFMITTMDAL